MWGDVDGVVEKWKCKMYSRYTIRTAVCKGVHLYIITLYYVVHNVLCSSASNIIHGTLVQLVSVSSHSTHRLKQSKMFIEIPHVIFYTNPETGAP